MSTDRLSSERKVAVRAEEEESEDSVEEGEEQEEDEDEEEIEIEVEEEEGDGEEKVSEEESEEILLDLGDFASRADSTAAVEDDDGDSGDPSVKHKVSFLKPEEIFEEKKRDIESVASICSLSFSNAGLLLRYFKWNLDRLQEDYFGNEAEVLQKAGIGEEEVIETTGNCGVCFEEGVRCLALSCRHTYCRECWKRYLETRIEESGLLSVATGCIHPSCPLLCPDSLFSVVSDELRERFESFQLRHIVDQSRSIEWCPGVNCDRVFRRTKRSGYVVCDHCLHGTCLNCLLEQHAPLTCEEKKMWTKKQIDDSETYNWIKSHTKGCPKCSALIEKNGGCMHMSCKKCGHEFCWVCLELWVTHGRNYYECKNPQRAEEVERRESKTNLKHYLERYTAWLEDNTKQKEVLSELTKMKELERQYAESHPWLQLDILFDAHAGMVETLCRLKHTHAFLWFFPNCQQQELLQHQQQEARKCIAGIEQIIAFRELQEKRTELFDLRDRMARIRSALVEIAKGARSSEEEPDRVDVS